MGYVYVRRCVYRAEHLHTMRLEALLLSLHVAVGPSNIRRVDATVLFAMLDELELELIQTHMAQKQVLRVEVGARALRVRSVSGEVAWASAATGP